MKPPEIQELIDHLVRTTRLAPPEAARLVAEVVSFFAEAPDRYVQRRHGELQADGLKNPAIFHQIADELRQRRFAAPEYSPRQLRRIVYG